MDDLVEWLRAQLDEDERVAADGIHTAFCVNDVRYPEECVCGWSARVLREVEAKRRILDVHGIIWRDLMWLERDEGDLVEGEEELPVCVNCVPKHSSFPARADVPVGPCVTVRLLALSYSDRPGYREEWRP